MVTTEATGENETCYVSFQVPVSFKAAIDRAAKDGLCNRSTIIRQALAQKIGAYLESEGDSDEQQ